jgi:HEPN domain-containing protein
MEAGKLRLETEPWWRQAQADLHAAELNGEIALYFVVTWLAQQAAEKALKALYIEWRGEEPPRTHAVQYLGRELVVPPTVQVDLDSLAPAFGEARDPPAGGPAPADSIEESVAERYLAAARRVLMWIESELQPS